MKFGITARMAVLASALVLIMTSITGWVFYRKASNVLTNQELERLGDNTGRIGQILSTDIRQLRSDSWTLTQKEQKDAVAYKLLGPLQKEKGRPYTANTEALVEQLEKAFTK